MRYLEYQAPWWSDCLQGFPIPDGVNEAQGGEVDGGGHAADLVPALVDLQLDPVVGMLCGTGWGRALPRRAKSGEPGLGGQVEDLPLALSVWGARARRSSAVGRLDLDVGLPDFAAAVAFENAALQVVVVGQQKALGIPVEAPTG